ncbi:MAG: glycosyltransferase family 2 protein [Planctomyces sp.]|nr:glycosyltransferase family 2 protein [Planctomyces sp.]
MSWNPSVTIVIPTLGRGQVLLNTIRMLKEACVEKTVILVIDQTPKHEPAIEKQLRELNEAGTIQWIIRTVPSITAAMNDGLLRATSELVLFVDDDIEPLTDLVSCHRAAFLNDEGLWATVGKIIQPWQKSEDVPPRVGLLRGLRKDMDFRFNSTRNSEVENTMAGNLCVHRERVLAIGGFDNNFIGSAIQFETDFARRVVRAGGRIQFLGSAGLNHLAAGKGGTRQHGSHLTCGNAMHSVGGYYYAFRNAGASEAWWYSIKRMFRQIRTKFHLTHPWWIPVKLTGELRALMLARKLYRQGPRLIAENRPEGVSAEETI